MPDITMCKDDTCPLRWKCYRYMAIPSGRQSYFTESPREVARCEYFDGSVKTRKDVFSYAEFRKNSEAMHTK